MSDSQKAKAEKAEAKAAKAEAKAAKSVPAAGTVTEAQAGKDTATGDLDRVGTIAEARKAGEAREKLKIEAESPSDRVKLAGESAAGSKEAELSALKAQQDMDESVMVAGHQELPKLGGPNIPEKPEA